MCAKVDKPARGEGSGSKGFRSSFDQFFSSQKPMFSLSSKVWSPPADVYETPDGIVVKIEIAGVSIDDLDILAKGSTLTVSGSRGDAEQSRQTAVHHVEIRHGNFERTFELPGGIDSENIQAEYEHGFLIIRIPKRNDPPKQIKIKTE